MAVFRTRHTLQKKGPPRQWLSVIVVFALLSVASARLWAYGDIGEKDATAVTAPTVVDTQAEGAKQPADAESFLHQRAVADEVLRRPEFQRDLSETWWQQKKKQLFGVLERIFGRVSRLGHAAPWLVKTLEWTLFVGAALGLLIFLLRQMARQRLRVELGTGGIKAEAWTREASDWEQRAEAFAAESAWRDAVHCLYWAAIVLLESRRAWRHNPTRTPREYVRLLKPGSGQQAALRGLTQIFERSWYGLREVDAAEYTEAKALYDGLMTPRLDTRQAVSERLEAERL
jgi:hypothetical protein